MTAARYIPEGYHTVTAALTVKDASQAIQFYEKAFGARVISRLDWPDGRLMHAEIQIGDSRVMLGEECAETGSLSPVSLNASSGSLCMYVQDVDAVFNQAIEAGGQTVMPVEDMFWGDRAGLVADPSGHRWFIMTHKQDLTNQEIKQRAEQFIASAGRK